MMTPLERITQLVSVNGDVNDPDTLRPLLSLEDFFEGNDVLGSIGCNLFPEQAPQIIYEHLRAIRERDDVSNVLVEITMFDDPDWPFSERVLVIARATPEEVFSWFDPDIAPSDCWEGWSENTDHQRIEVPAMMRPIVCWWD